MNAASARSAHHDPRRRVAADGHALPHRTEPSVPLRVPVPATDGPFVNARLTSLGRGPDGVERFWTSTWNAVSGATGLVISEDGTQRVHHFEPPHSGFYSAVATDPGTLWLCGDLSCMVRLDLDTGEYSAFPTGAPPALVFPGMAYDAGSGKLFAVAFAGTRALAVVLDTRTGATERMIEDVCPDHYQCGSFPSGDGTWTTLVYNPGVSLVRWDPRTDTVTTTSLEALWPDIPRPYDTRARIGHLIGDARGRIHLPGAGWYDPSSRRLRPGPTPERDLAWFGRDEHTAWGVRVAGDDAIVSRWELGTGTVRDLCSIPDATAESVALTADGDVVAVSVFGRFTRLDGRTGDLLLQQDTCTAAVGDVDCLRRIGTQLYGTTFITQRFWSVDLLTGAGTDLGRAAPGSGEVLQTWEIDGMLYMAAYTGGTLTRFDPAVPAEYGRNPEPVLAPAGALRPVAAADDGRVLFYACTHHYGTLGCLLIRYDAPSGDHVVEDDPLPLLAVTSLHLHVGTCTLVAGTTVEADSDSAPAQADRVRAAVFDPTTLRILGSVDLPVGPTRCEVLGAFDRTRVMMRATRPEDGADCWFLLDPNAMSVPEARTWVPFPAGTRDVLGTHRDGTVVLRRSGRNGTEEYQVQDLRGPGTPRTVLVARGTRIAQVQEDDLFVTTASEVIVVRDALSSVARTG